MLLVLLFATLADIRLLDVYWLVDPLLLRSHRLNLLEASAAKCLAVLAQGLVQYHCRCEIFHCG